MKNIELYCSDTKVTRETLKALDEGYRLIAHQGGTRSGKTYSLSEFLICHATATTDNISVVSATFPHLSKGAMRDWKEIMIRSNFYDENQHNKTDKVYTYPNKNYIEFFSADSGDKVRGPGRNILYINEINLLDRETFIQLNIRTTDTVIFDYNAADEFHWIYDEILPREDCYFVQTTYLDNPFLSQVQIDEIEKLKNLGGNYWKVYGLGERGTREGLIYPNHVVTNEWKNCKIHGYGLDFGFSNDPTALVEIGIQGNETFEKELIYETGLTNSDLIAKLKLLGISKKDPIWADSAEPQRIEEIYRAGYNIHPVKKGPDSIKIGIDACSRFKRNIHSSSSNMIKEIKSYAWAKDKNENNTGKPIPFNDHAMDASRYFIGSVATKGPSIKKRLYFT